MELRRSFRQELVGFCCNVARSDIVDLDLPTILISLDHSIVSVMSLTSMKYKDLSTFQPKPKDSLNKTCSLGRTLV